MQHLYQAAREVRVPGVAVHHIGGAHRAAHDEILEQGREELRVTGILGRQGDGGLDPGDRQARRAFTLSAEAQNLHLMTAAVERGELAGQILHVHARAAVHVRRVLVGQDRDLHTASG